MTNTGILMTDAYSWLDPNPAWPYGEATVSAGLYTRQAVSGIGLMTRGFIWEIYSIWIDSEGVQNLSTTWSATADAGITTTWTPVANGIWGDSTPSF